MSWWQNDPIAPGMDVAKATAAWWQNDPVADAEPEQDPRITELQKPGAAQRMLRVFPGVGGLLDEAGALADAGINWATGGRSGEDYDTSLDRRRDAMAKSDAENPIRNTIDMGLGIAATAGALPVIRAFSGNGMMSGAANAGANAVAYGAPALFAEGEGSFENRVQNVKDNLPAAAALSMGGGALLNRLANRAGGTPQNAVTREADSIGVEVPKFMEGGRATQQMAGKFGAIPFVGDDINAAVLKTRNQSEDAAVRMANRVAGVGTGPREAGDAASEAMVDFVGPRARQIQELAYGKVEKAMANAMSPLNETRKAVAELSRQQNAAAIPMHAQAISAIEEAVTRPGGLTFEGLSRLRTAVGTMMDNTLDPNNRVAAGGLKALYGSLSRDMEAAITQAGGPRVTQLWRRANNVTKMIAERRDTVSKIIGADAGKAGEGIVDKIVTMASTKSSADFARLNQARRVMGQEAWRQVAGVAIVRLGRNQSNQFSPDIFLKNYTQLSDDGRRALFHFAGDKNLQRELDALAAVSVKLQQFSKLGNPSGTGGVAALLSALAGAASGDMGSTAATALGGRVIGRLMAQPAVIRNVTAYSRRVEMFLRGKASRAAVSVAAVALANSVAKETGEDSRAIRQRIDVKSVPKP